MSKYDYGVFIGRFQIPHYGHFHIMEEALKVCNTLIIAIGSSNLGRSLKNPFNFEQRAMLIENCGVPAIEDAFKDGRIKFIGLEDSPYSDQWWLEQVQRKVTYTVHRSEQETWEYYYNVKKVQYEQKTNPKIAIIGCEKDASSYYIKLFPQWDLVEFDPKGNYAATDCRNAYYEFGPEDKSVLNKLTDLTTIGVVEALKFIPKFVHEDLQRRFNYVKEYREQWGEGPFDTADAVVIKNGHVLMIRRGKEDFNKDVWALPGGFIEKTDATPYFASLRELEEETGLKADWHDNRQWLPVSNDKFDKPDRDERAKIVTYAFCYILLDDGPLPDVEGRDDAVHAQWVPLADLRADNCYNDHYFIIRKLIAGL